MNKKGIFRNLRRLGFTSFLLMLKPKKVSKVRLTKIFIVTLLIIFLSSFVTDWGFLKSEITAYPIFCYENLGIYDSLNPTTYKISKKRQEVMEWTKNYFPIERLSNCIIVDRKNWTCEYVDKSGKFGFTEGQFWFIPLGDSKIQYVSRSIWLYYHLSGISQTLFFNK